MLDTSVNNRTCEYEILYDPRNSRDDLGKLFPRGNMRVYVKKRTFPNPHLKFNVHDR